MYGLVEYEFLRRRHDDIRRGVAMEPQTSLARERRERRPYVVRDLSWELARYLDTEDSSALAEERLAG